MEPIQQLTFIRETKFPSFNELINKYAKVKAHIFIEITESYNRTTISTISFDLHKINATTCRIINICFADEYGTRRYVAHSNSNDMVEYDSVNDIIMKDSNLSDRYGDNFKISFIDALSSIVTSVPDIAGG
jgi:uncharacterized secreted protein with C-terminal beta-propeller domain